LVVELVELVGREFKNPNATNLTNATNKAMINLDFTIAVALYLFASVGLVFCIWVFLRRKEFFEDFVKDYLSPRFIWCCSICAYTYFTTHKKEISVCPRCGSYNKYSIENSNISAKGGFAFGEKKQISK